MNQAERASPAGRRLADVMERARTDAALQRADAFAESVIETANIIFMQVDATGIVRRVNAAAEKTTGYTRAEMEGMSWFDVMVPTDRRPDARADFDRVMTGGEGATSGSCESVIRNKAGEDRHILWSRTILSEGDRRVGIISFGMDMTQHRRAAVLAEEERQRSRRDADRLAAIVESSSDAIYAKSIDGTIVAWNASAERLFGYTPEEVMGRSAHILLMPPGAKDELAAILEKIRSGGRIDHKESSRVRKDGSHVLVSLSESPLRDGEGNVVGVSVIARDVSAQRASDERFEKVFLSSLVAIGIAETESGLLVDVNDRCAEFFGYTRAEMIGRTVFELGLWINPADRERLVTGMSDGGPGARVETAFRCKSGAIRHALVSMEDITLAGVPEPLNIMVLVDTAERKELESQLLQAQKMEAVGRLAGGVAHDFNNSLGVILGYTELLMREAQEPQWGKLAHILKATQRASALTRQLLAFSRKQIVDPRVLDLNLLLTDLQTMLSRLIGEDVDLAIVAGEDLGHVRADAGQLEQVVMNLCVNARDAMPQGGLLRIETSNEDLDGSHVNRHEAVASGRYVMVAVSDSGAGIPKEIVGKIFEPFFTTKELGKGTGLGLAMVYGIVKQAGGYVWVYSEVGTGTTFKIYLPRIDEPLEEMPAPETSMPARGTETVLLVEDEGSLRAIAREILEEHGYQVIDAAGPTEALASAASHPHPIDLLITDVVMPGMNGRVLAQTLAATRPALKVLYMSGYTDDVIAQSGVLESGTLLLEKPFTARALLGRVRKALGPEEMGANA